MPVSICHHCSSKIEQSARFCQNCGIQSSAPGDSHQIDESRDDVSPKSFRQGTSADRWAAIRNDKNASGSGLAVVIVVILSGVIFFCIANYQNFQAQQRFQEMGGGKPLQLERLTETADFSTDTYGHGFLAAPGQIGFLGLPKIKTELQATGENKDSTIADTRELCADSIKTFQTYSSAKLAGYDQPIQELLKQHHLFYAPSGTQVKVLNAYKMPENQPSAEWLSQHPNENTPAADYPVCDEIRITSGAFRKKICFVNPVSKVDPRWLDKLNADERHLVAASQKAWMISWTLNKPLAECQMSQGVTSSELVDHLYSIFKIGGSSQSSQTTDESAYSKDAQTELSKFSASNIGGGEAQYVNDLVPRDGVLTAASYSQTMAELDKHLKALWRAPKKDSSYKISVDFDLFKNGIIQNPTIFKSSGDTEADKAALAAVENGSNADIHLPDGAHNPTRIRFTFSYTVERDRGLAAENYDSLMKSETSTMSIFELQDKRDNQVNNFVYSRAFFSRCKALSTPDLEAVFKRAQIGSPSFNVSCQFLRERGVNPMSFIDTYHLIELVNEERPGISNNQFPSELIQRARSLPAENVIAMFRASEPGSLASRLIYGICEQRGIRMH